MSGIAPPPQHLMLPVLKALAPRLLALPIFRRCNLLSGEGEVLRRFCPTVAEVTARSPNAQNLGDFVADQLQLAVAHAKTLPLPERDAVIVKLEDVKIAVDALRCAVCAVPSGHRCNGSDTAVDDAQIRIGHCVELLSEVHRHVVDRAERILTHNTDLVGNASISRTAHQWASEWTGRAQREWPTQEYKAHASTVFLDSQQVPFAEIRLNIGVEQLDWSSLLAVPWLFTHEIMCHVAQVYVGKPREACRPSCPFYEGWMDELAYQCMLSDLVSGWHGSSVSAFVQEHRSVIATAAGDFRAMRYGTRPGDNPRVEARVWEGGADALRAVLQFLESVVGDPALETRKRVALAHAIALSLKIQSCDPLDLELDAVVGAVYVASTTAMRGDSEQRIWLLEVLTASIPDITNFINKLRSV